MTTTTADASSRAGAHIKNSAPKEPAQRLEIEILYLDLTRCSRCIGTDSVMTQAIDDARGVLTATGIDVSARRTHVQSFEDAQRLGFVSSPTIRINGRDIALALEESPCSNCNSLSGTAVNCRSWTWRGEKYSVPPKGMILEAILREAFGNPRAAEPSPSLPHEVPENLRRFFEEGKSCCGGSCSGEIDPVIDAPVTGRD